MTNTATPAAVSTFKVGATYSARSLCDYDCIWTWTVTKRTAKFITLADDRGEVRRVGVSVWDGAEIARPFGSYSMAPSIHADHEGRIR